MRPSEQDARRAVGFVGLGAMGLPMATTLLASGRAVIGYDHDRSRLEAASDHGVESATSCADLVRRSPQAVLVAVCGSDQVADVLFGDSGLTAAAPEQLDVVVFSTLSPAAISGVAERARPFGVTLVDAPVSGGVRAARDGTLTMIVSGEDAAVGRVQHLLEVLAAPIHNVGREPGRAQAFKLVNQLMMGVALTGTLEGLTLAEGFEIRAEEIVSVLDQASGSSWVLQHWDALEPQLAARPSGLQLVLDDLRTALGAAKVALPVTELSLNRLTTVVNEKREEPEQRDR